MIGLALAGCASSGNPPAGAQVTKQFSGGPMPPEMRKQFEESREKSQQLTQQRAQSAGKH